MKKLVPESPFNKLAGLQDKILIKLVAPPQVLFAKLHNASRYLQLPLVLRQVIISHEVNYIFVFTFFTRMCLTRIIQGILTALVPNSTKDFIQTGEIVAK